MTYVNSQLNTSFKLTLYRYIEYPLSRFEMNRGVLRAVGYKTSETFVETGVVPNSAGKVECVIQ